MVKEAVEQMGGKLNWISSDGRNNIKIELPQWNNISLEIGPFGSKIEFKIFINNILR